jgi:tripartite-type tricarboxylate transporter receptor subunit TctC
MSKIKLLSLILSGVAMLSVEAAQAQPADFYKGKQIRIVVGNATGGDYDLGARLLARHMSNHIAGAPTVIVQNMPGASGNTAANFLYAVAPKDGTVFGSFSRNLPSQAALGRLKIDVDPRRYSWIGATSLPSRICVAWENASVKTAEETFSKELILGSTGPGSIQSIVPTVLNKVIDTKFKPIEGYRGISEIMIAMERGEVKGVCHLLSVFESVHADLLQQGKIRPLFNVEEASIESLPDMPSIYKFIKDEDSKQLLRFVFSSAEFGRPYAAPPEVPADRVAELRKAFAATVKDKKMLEEAERLKLDMTYRSPEDLMALINNLYATPPTLITRIDELLPNVSD